MHVTRALFEWLPVRGVKEISSAASGTKPMGVVCLAALEASSETTSGLVCLAALDLPYEIQFGCNVSVSNYCVHYRLIKSFVICCETHMRNQIRLNVPEWARPTCFVCT